MTKRIQREIKTMAHSGLTDDAIYHWILRHIEMNASEEAEVTELFEAAYDARFPTEEEEYYEGPDYIDCGSL